MGTEVKSYSSALTKKLPPDVTSPEALKKIVKAVAEEEDRCTHIMLFGLEEKNETLSNLVGEVFVSVGEKPSFVASRAGKNLANIARPLKVTLTGMAMVQ